MRTLPLKPNDKKVAACHASLADFAKLGVKHKTAVRAAFQASREDRTSLVNTDRADTLGTDRIGEEGVVAYVTDSGFVDGIARDGVRQRLARDFDKVFVLDLGGNVRQNPKLSGTKRNVFGIQVGVSINVFGSRRKKAGAAE